MGNTAHDDAAGNRRDPIEPARPATPGLRLAFAREAMGYAIGEFVEAMLEARAGAATYYTQATSPLGRRRHSALARTGVLPARKVGRSWMVRREDLERYILTYGSPAPDEEPAEVILRRILSPEPSKKSGRKGGRRA